MSAGKHAPIAWPMGYAGTLALGWDRNITGHQAAEHGVRPPRLVFVLAFSLSSRWFW